MILCLFTRQQKTRGWGVRTLSPIRQGTFIGLYTGELIPESITEYRGLVYDQIGRTYLFDLDLWHIRNPPKRLGEIDPEGAERAREAAEQLNGADGERSSAFTVDAFHWGNVSPVYRWIPHSAWGGLLTPCLVVPSLHDFLYVVGWWTCLPACYADPCAFAAEPFVYG